MTTNKDFSDRDAGSDKDHGNDFEFQGEPGHMVRRLHQIGVSIFLDLMKEFDLTPIQYGALNAIGTHPGYEQRQIARMIAVDRTTINAVTKRLAERGLLIRKPIGRRIDLWLTDQGHRLLDAASPKTPIHSDVLLAPLTSAQRRQFVKLLKRVVDGNNSVSRVPMEKPDQK